MGDPALKEMVTQLALPPFLHQDEPFHLEGLQYEIPPPTPTSTPDQRKGFLNLLWTTIVWPPYVQSLDYRDFLFKPDPATWSA